MSWLLAIAFNSMHSLISLVIHITARHGRTDGLLLLGHLGHHRLCRQQQLAIDVAFSNASEPLSRSITRLSQDPDTLQLLHEAEIRIAFRAHFFNDDRAFMPAFCAIVAAALPARAARYWRRFAHPVVKLVFQERPEHE